MLREHFLLAGLANCCAFFAVTYYGYRRSCKTRTSYGERERKHYLYASQLKYTWPAKVTAFPKRIWELQFTPLCTLKLQFPGFFESKVCFKCDTCA